MLQSAYKKKQCPETIQHSLPNTEPIVGLIFLTLLMMRLNPLLIRDRVLQGPHIDKVSAVLPESVQLHYSNFP